MLSSILGDSGELCFSSSSIGSLVLSNFLTKHITSQFRLLIIVALCWMEASWLPTVLNMLVDIPHCYPIIKHLVMDVSVDWVLSGLPLLHLTCWLLREERASWCAQEGVPSNALLCLMLLISWSTCLGLD